jgi:hypothetical protein
MLIEDLWLQVISIIPNLMAIHNINTRFDYTFSSPIRCSILRSMTGSYHLHHVAPTVAVEHLDQLPEMK